MNPVRKILCGFVAAVSLVHCERQDEGELRQAYHMTSLNLSLQDSLGIHPSRSVLDLADNPFRAGNLSRGDPWQQYQALRLDEPDHLTARFYFWATWLAQKPSGERQLMAALALRELYQTEQYQRSDLCAHMLQAFAAVIQYFPEDLGYTGEGYSYKLADAAQNVIEDLNECP